MQQCRIYSFQFGWTKLFKRESAIREGERGEKAKGF